MRYSTEELKKLALAQINFLQQRIGGGLWVTLINSVLQEACYQGSLLNMGDKEIPILMIFPTCQEIFGPIVQMMTVKINGKSGGGSYYGWQKIVDDPPVPDVPYFALGVSIGLEEVTMSGEMALKKILSQQKTPLTCGENIALATHYAETLFKPDWLGSAALGSRTKNEKGEIESCFPLIDMTDDYPLIKGRSFSTVLDRVNFPSCHLRSCDTERSPQMEFELGA